MQWDLRVKKPAGLLACVTSGEAPTQILRIGSLKLDGKKELSSWAAGPPQSRLHGHAIKQPFLLG